MYDADCLDAAWDLVKDWTEAERESLRRNAPVMGLAAPIRTETLRDVAIRVLEIAREGLKRRAMLSVSGDDETRFLTELEEIARTGLNPAQVLIAKFKTDWNGDVRHAFKECAF